VEENGNWKMETGRGYEFPVSNFQFQISNFQFQISNFKFPLFPYLNLDSWLLLPIADGHWKELPHHFFNRQSAIVNLQSPILWRRRINPPYDKKPTPKKSKKSPDSPFC
jgi:hypothetical protein